MRWTVLTFAAIVVLVLLAVPGKLRPGNTFVYLHAVLWVCVTDVGKGGILILISLWTSEVFIIIRARQWLNTFTCTAIVAVFLAVPGKLIPGNTFVHLHAVFRVGVTDIGKGRIPILVWLWTSEIFIGIGAHQ